MTSNSLDTKVRIANLYYRQNMSQQEIAQEMNLSRTTVSRILKNCIDEGIVTIRIKNTSIYQYELEAKLVKKYGLRHVSVVNEKNDKEMILKAIGDATCEYLKSVVKSNVRIGVSAGTTILGITPYLHGIENYNIDVFQMQGDASHQTSNCSSFLTIDIAKKLGGTAHAMHVPLLVHTKVLRDLLLEEPFNKKHFQELQNLDIAIVGIGLLDAILPDTSDTWYNYVADKDEIIRKKGVGDVCGRFIDCDGAICRADIQDRTIAIPLESVKEIPYCIGVAFGKKKKCVVKAAIEGGYVNVLMIDEGLACALLEEDEKERP